MCFKNELGKEIMQSIPFGRDFYCLNKIHTIDHPSRFNFVLFDQLATIQREFFSSLAFRLKEEKIQELIKDNISELLQYLLGKIKWIRKNEENFAILITQLDTPKEYLNQKGHREISKESTLIIMTLRLLAKEPPETKQNILKFASKIYDAWFKNIMQMFGVRLRRNPWCKYCIPVYNSRQ